MRIKSVLLVILLSFSTNSFAYISSDGDEFTVEYNKHGAVLTSVHEKHYWVGHGAGSTTVTKKATIYLGNNCDASSEFYGKGTWAWANGGFIIKFQGKELGFARQELQIENNGECRM